MADAATATDSSPTPPPAPAAGSDFSSDFDKLSKDLATSKRAQIAEESKVSDESIKNLEADRARMKTYFDREGVGLDDIKPWDAKAEARKVDTNPLESFGSFASVFGIMASLFTKAPMMNALNASAAAMNAVHARDEEAYNRAFAAYKTNVDLAIKRHNMMHEDYQDAANLMTTDTQIGEAKLRELATKYGDRNALLFLDHGMSTELFQMMQARANAMEGIEKANKEMDLSAFEKQAREADPDWHSPYIDKRMAAYKRSMQIEMKTPVDEQAWDRVWASDEVSKAPQAQKMDTAMKLWRDYKAATYGARGSDKRAYIDQRASELMQQNPNMLPTQAMLQAEQEYAVASRAPTVAERQDKPIEDDVRKEHPDWTQGQVNLEVQKRMAAAKHTDARPTVSGEVAKLIEAKKTELKQKHPDWSDAKIGEEAIKAAKQAAASPITGNERAKVEAHIQQYDESIKTIDRVVATLHRYSFAAGAPGMANRMGERIEDLLGSHQTDRVQMARDIEYLQLNATRLLLDVSTGRPLSAEASAVKDIIAGLSLGDTTANTIRALQDVKDRYERLKLGNQQRIGEAPADTPSAAAAPPGNDNAADQPWLQAPLKKGP